MISIISVWVYFFIFHKATTLFDKNFAGPFQIIFQRIEPCSNESNTGIILHNYKLNKINNTLFTFTTKLDFNKPLDEKSKMMLNVAVWGNGGWRDNFFLQTVNDPCAYALRVLPKYWLKALHSIGLKGCPIPVGSYMVKDLVFDLDLQMKTLPYNKHKAIIDIYHEKTKTLCFLFYFEIVPKRVIKG